MMQTADPMDSAIRYIKELRETPISVADWLFLIGGQDFRKPTQLNLLLLTQPSVQTNQAALDACEAVPFEFGVFNASAFVFRAIQHAYYSIKCIAESTLSGRELALERGGDECRTCFVTS